MYDTRPNLVIGFHGCDLSRRESLLNNSGPLKKVKNHMIGLGMAFIFGKITLQGRPNGQRTKRAGEKLRSRL